MTSSVPPLKELAGQVVIANNDLNALQVTLLPELTDYLKAISGELSLNLATQFYDKYYEVYRALAAVGGQDADVNGIDQFLAEWQQVLHLHDSAAEALTAALQVAVNVADPAWREYLLTTLTEVQDHVTTLGGRAENTIEYLTIIRSAF
jgi:hypothetical protein